MTNEKIGSMLLNIIDKAGNKYLLLNDLILFCNELRATTTGAVKADTYEILRVLSNSINNTGWEARHSEQIGYINKCMYDISEKYEDYLP